MAQWYFPFADNNGDRAYNDTDFAHFFGTLFVNGVFANVGNALQIKQSASLGMRVNIGTGAAIINGRMYLNTVATDLIIPVASTMQDRTDSVVLRLDLGARTIQTIYKQSDVTVTRNNNVYELQLATIRVLQNATDITNANITDKRGDSSVSGYASPFEKVPVDGLVAQYEDLLSTFLDDSKADFEGWFQNLQDQLDDNQASNLQNQITTLQNTMASTTLHRTGDETASGKKTFTGGVSTTNLEVSDISIPVQPLKLWTKTTGWGMNASQVVTPTKKLTECLTGWILVWREFNTAGEVVNSGLNYQYIPKVHAIFDEGYGVSMYLTHSNQTNSWTKYLYVTNDNLTGHANNWRTEDDYGVNSKHWVLTAIYEY